MLSFLHYCLVIRSKGSSDTIVTVHTDFVSCNVYRTVQNHPLPNSYLLEAQRCCTRVTRTAVITTLH